MNNYQERFLEVVKMRYDLSDTALRLDATDLDVEVNSKLIYRPTGERTLEGAPISVINVAHLENCRDRLRDLN